MASSSLLSLALCLLVLFHTSLAQLEHGKPQRQHSEQQIKEQLENETGDQNNIEQLEDAGIATIRYSIQPNQKKISIVVEGNGYIEIPDGIAETIQSSQQSEGDIDDKATDYLASLGYAANRDYSANRGYAANRGYTAHHYYPYQANRHYSANAGYSGNRHYQANRGYSANRDYSGNYRYSG